MVPEYIMVQKTKCPECNKENVIKWCKRKTLNRGIIQRYSCKDCGKKFSLDNGFLRMRNDPKKISLCLDLFYKGISTRQIQSHLQAFYPHNSSHKSIYKWVVKYSKIISKYTDKLKIKAGKEIQIDEMEVGSRKSKYNGWFIDSIDTETRFMIASEFTSSRGQKEVRRVLQNVKRKTGNQISVYTTDGFTTYEDVIKKLVGYRNLKKGLVVHNKVTQLKGEGFNHKIERLHNSVRHRIKTFRGFHGSVSSANAIMKGYGVYYNFMREHLAIGCCPYELAVPEMKEKLNVPNKWLALVSMATQNN